MLDEWQALKDEWQLLREVQMILTDKQYAMLVDRIGKDAADWVIKFIIEPNDSNCPYPGCYGPHAPGFNHEPTSREYNEALSEALARDGQLNDAWDRVEK